MALRYKKRNLSHTQSVLSVVLNAHTGWWDPFIIFRNHTIYQLIYNRRPELNVRNVEINFCWADGFRLAWLSLQNASRFAHVNTGTLIWAVFMHLNGEEISSHFSVFTFCSEDCATPFVIQALVLIVFFIRLHNDHRSYHLFIMRNIRLTLVNKEDFLGAFSAILSV